MDESPYIRDGLTATRQGIPDPLIEVGAWIDRLETTLASEGPDWSAHGAYDLLAGWGKLMRTKPDLVQGLGGSGFLAEAQKIIIERGSDLARLALSVPNPAAWREETTVLADSYEQLMDPVERSTLAERLITDLDDAELVLHALGHLGMRDGALEGEIEGCRLWLMEHADLFLAAGVHIQAAGMALRPDLSEHDYSLAVTALKYERLLDAALEVEAELAFEDLRPIEQGELDALCRAFRRGAAVRSYPRSVLQSGGLAAASKAGAPLILKWTSPDGRWLAYLPIPAEGGIFAIRFYGSAGEPAAGLAGERVFLAGVAAEVNTEARAEFDSEAVAESLNDFSLEVGDPKVAWRPDEE
jgi:hypothetical protein